MSSLLVPALRRPRHCNLASQLGDWLDVEGATRVGVSRNECSQDLQRIDQLRLQVEEALQGDHGLALSKIHVLEEYAKALEDSEHRGFPSGEHIGTRLLLQWESTEGNLETYTSLTWDRVNVVWNLAALYVYQASKVTPLVRLEDYKQAGNYLDTAIVLLGHLHHNMLPLVSTHGVSVEMTRDYLAGVQACIAADLQRVAGYSNVTNKPKPVHQLCAKIAAGCATLYQKVEACGIYQPWAHASKIGVMYMNALGQYHQSQVNKAKSQHEMELSHVQAAIGYAGNCCDLCETDDPYMFLERAVELMCEMDFRRMELIDLVDATYIVPPDDFTPISPHYVGSSGNTTIDAIIPPLKTPLFANILDDKTRYAVEQVHDRLYEWLTNVCNAADDKTDVGQRTLQILKLPNAITAYRQSQQGGGLPQDLWMDVKAIQDNNTLSQLKQQLWSLKEASDYAISTLAKVDNALKDNIEMDKLFRLQFPKFDGLNVRELQETYGKTLDTYSNLMESAKLGDSMILNRLDDLDKDVRFRLVLCKRSDLDRLIPYLRERNIDLTRLELHLKELSDLFKKREIILDELNGTVEGMDIASAYRSAVEKLDQGTQPDIIAADISQTHFKTLLVDLQQNMEVQNLILRLIREENEIFVQQRTMSHAVIAGEKCITLLHDAIEELEILSKHLQEGLSFYDSFIPKLESLHDQVGRMSDRLTDARRAHAEGIDGRVVQTPAAAVAAAAAQPFAQSMSRSHLEGEPDEDLYFEADHMSVRKIPARDDAPRSDVASRPKVDDEKMANLINMGFDPERIVEALSIHDNNFESALNELLTG